MMKYCNYKFLKFKKQEKLIKIKKINEAIRFYKSIPSLEEQVIFDRFEEVSECISINDVKKSSPIFLMPNYDLDTIKKVFVF